MITDDQRTLFLAIESADFNVVSEFLNGRDDVLSTPPTSSKTWLGEAARSGSVEIVETLINAGCDVNCRTASPDKLTPLESAILQERYNVAEFLLKKGADPNLGRPLIYAFGSRLSAESQLEFTKLLILYGADVNRLYDLRGDRAKEFTALDWTSNQAVADYLRSQGGKTAKELKALKATEVETLSDISEEVIRYLERDGSSS